MRLINDSQGEIGKNPAEASEAEWTDARSGVKKLNYADFCSYRHKNIPHTANTDVCIIVSNAQKILWTI